MTLNQIRLAVALFGAAAISAGSAWSGYWVRDKAAKQAIQRAQLENSEAVRVAVQLQLDAIIDRSKVIQQAEAEHDKNQRIINSFTDRVRIVVPASSCTVSEVALATDSDAASRVSPTRIEAGLAEAQREIERIGQTCAQLNIDAIRANARMGQ